MKRRAIIFTAIAWMMIVVAIASAGLTSLLMNNGESAVVHVVSEQEYQMIQRYRRLDEVRSTLVETYYEPVDEEALMLGAIRGMMGSLEDPYTFYYTAEEMAQENDESRGVYHGVGMVVQLTEDGGIEVLQVYDGSPAGVAGILPGDRLIRVDGTDVSGENSGTLDAAIELIRGEDGTVTVLTVLRDGQEISYDVVRGEVSVSYIEYQWIGDNVGYISLSQFSGNAVEGFQEALDEFRDTEVQGVIVDLRSNPGGLLDVVVDIADMVLPEGVVTYVEDRNGNREDQVLDDEYWDIPMVVLVNGMSASASELFSAAFQDYDRGTVVGTQTFGKGIVQTLITFAEDGAGMQLTTESYFSPLGRSIHKVGVTPDIVVELWDSYDPYVTEPDMNNDNQLAAAYEELLKLAGDQE